MQVVLARGSNLLGKTVRETRFRTRFDAAIIALHRAGQRQRTRIGDIQLAVSSMGAVPCMSCCCILQILCVYVHRCAYILRATKHARQG